MSGSKRQSLVEGVDYYLEGKRFVFTSAYHLKRGYCCNSKCRHCPYKNGAVQLPQLQLIGLPTIKLPTDGG